MDKSETKRQRKLKNYLLDKNFQLKYTGLVVGISFVLCLILGYFLYKEIVASEDTILARELGSNVISIAPGKADKVLEAQNAILEEFNDIQEKRSEETIIVKINSQPSRDALVSIENVVNREKVRKRNILISSLTVFILFLLIGGIYLTHKIAGPAYKMKLLFNKIDGENLNVEGSLRKGDELKEVFTSFINMIDRIRDYRKEEVKVISNIIAEIEEGNNITDATKEKLKALKDKLDISIQ